MLSAFAPNLVTGIISFTLLSSCSLKLNRTLSSSSQSATSSSGTPTTTTGSTFAFTSVSPIAGPTAGGTSITINGTGFVSGGSFGVAIGGSACAIASSSSTSIVCTTPSGTAGAKNIVITNSGGQTVTATGAFTYSAAAAPTYTSVSPASGPAAGGTSITITGTNFVSGGSFGVTVGGSACTIASSTAISITCTTPAGSAGARDIVITNNDGQAVTGTGAFTYIAPPSFTSVSPSSGPTAGSTSITITGSNFVSGGSFGVTVGGSACTVGSSSATSITCTTPAGTAGAKNIVITNNDGQSVTATGAFTYVAAPTYTSVSPTSGPAAGGTSITITGTNFVSGGSFGVTVGGSACTVGSSSGTSITCTTPSGTAGAKNIVITNNDGQTVTGTGAFTYVAAPTFTSVSPSGGTTAGGTSVTITGTNFVSGGSFGVTVGGSACTIGSSGATSITCTTPSGTAGAKNIVITNNDGQTVTGTGAYTYSVPPTFTSVSPTSGSTGGGTSITITGTNFVSGGSFGVTVGGSACSVGSSSTTSITCTTPSGTAGAKNIVITNNDGQTVTGTGVYTYISPPAPTFTSVSPTSGSTNGGTLVTIVGTNFTSGGSAGVTVGGAACTGAVVTSDQITCTTPAGIAGAANVVVTNNDAQSVTGTGAFTYTAAAAPTLTKVVPSSGSISGGTIITVVGNNFSTAAAPAISVGGTACGSITVQSSTVMTCTTPSVTSGAKSILVTNPDGQAVTLVSGFTAYTYDTTTCTGARLTNAPFANSGEAGIAGTAAAPYLICTPTQFAAIGPSATYVTKVFKQGQNIDLTGRTLTISNSFTGTYDGQGFTISNATVAGTGNTSIFGDVMSGGVISNLVITSADMSTSGAASYVGTAAGYLDGVVANVTVNTSTIHGAGGALGGAVGNEATTASVVTNITVTSTSVTSTTSSATMGGAIGTQTGGLAANITVNTPTVNSQGNAGGALGDAYGSGVRNITVSNGTVSGGSIVGRSVGGAVGFSQAPLYKVSVLGTGVSTGASGNFGGIAGYEDQLYSIDTCSFTGTLTSTATGATTRTGGIVGYSGSPISNCTMSGSISSSESIIGGIGGEFGGNLVTSIAITNSSFTGTITAQTGNTYLSAIAGKTALAYNFSGVKAQGTVNIASSTTNYGGVLAYPVTVGGSIVKAQVSAHTIAGSSTLSCSSLVDQAYGTITLTDVSINNESLTGCSYSGAFSQLSSVTLNTNRFVISNSVYSAVTGAGAITGRNSTSTFGMNTAYWDSTATPTGIVGGCSAGTCPVGKTATVLRDPTDPSFSTFDQASIWLMSSGTFPQLR